MIDEENEIGFAIWTADTGNASRTEWNALGSGGQDNWRRMARAAIQRMYVLKL